VRLEKKTKALEESRDGLLNKIADAKANLETYKKSSFGT
jgi:flagellar motility protein MotE (MotC chaperone)